MNNIEKKKIEKIITGDIESSVKVYQAKREEELVSLVEKLEEKIPSNIKAMVKEAEELSKLLKTLKASALKLGWKIDESYHNGWNATLDYEYDRSSEDRSIKIYQAKELKEHSQKTISVVAKLKALSRSYTLKIYSGSAHMEKLLEGLSNDIAKLTA